MEGIFCSCFCSLVREFYHKICSFQASIIAVSQCAYQIAQNGVVVAARASSIGPQSIYILTNSAPRRAFASFSNLNNATWAIYFITGAINHQRDVETGETFMWSMLLNDGLSNDFIRPLWRRVWSWPPSNHSPPSIQNWFLAEILLELFLFLFIFTGKSILFVHAILVRVATRQIYSSFGISPWPLHSLEQKFKIIPTYWLLPWPMTVTYKGQRVIFDKSHGICEKSFGHHCRWNLFMAWPTEV